MSMHRYRAPIFLDDARVLRPYAYANPNRPKPRRRLRRLLLRLMRRPYLELP